MEDFEYILEQFEDYTPDPSSMDQEPRNMAQGGRMGFKGGTDPKTGMGFQKGNTMGQGRDLKGKPSINVEGKNQYKVKTTKEIQAIIDANPDYITPKNFYQPTDKMKQKGSKKLLTLTDTQNPDVIFQKKGKDPADPEKQTARNNKRNESRTRQEGRKYKVTPPKGYQVHHMLPLAGNVDINTGDLAVISKKMNAKMSKYDKIINKLTTEASLLDFSKKNSLKRLDDLNEQLNGVLKTIKKDLPKKYKGLIGFNKLTPVFDEYGTVLNLTAKPVGIDYKKSIAGSKGVPIRDVKTSDIQDLVNKAPKSKISKIQSKGIAKKLNDAGFKCSLANGVDCDDPRSYAKSIKENMAKASQGDKSAVSNIKKMGKLMNGFKGAAKFTGWGLLGEIGFAAPLAGLDYAKGANTDEIISNATYGLLGKSEDEQLREKYSDYGQAQDLLDTYNKSISQGEALQDQTGYGPIVNQQDLKNTENKLEKQSKEFAEVLPPSMGFKGDFDLNNFFRREEIDNQRIMKQAQEKKQRELDRDILTKSTGLEAVGLADGGLANLMKKYYD